ncbi:hypothetical protein BDE36_1127 [Arcticibacter tournemirensis]|nr:hypothetical protein BDE36_1127 [Arcticibacter tournemirensis]
MSYELWVDCNGLIKSNSFCIFVYMESFVVHTENIEQAKTVKAVLKALKVKFEKLKGEKSYSPEFVAKIKQSEKDFEEGNYTTISLDDIWK